MTMRGMLWVLLGLLLGPARLIAAEHLPGIELIQDNRFQHGFVLWSPQTGRHVGYGELRGASPDAKPTWGVAQWSSRFPLDPALARVSKGVMVCSNAAKTIAVRTRAGELTLAVNSREEYGATARKKTEPWVHLLIEQEFVSANRLAELSAVPLHVEARLLRSTNLHQGDYSTDRHAAQFQIFFTVQNRKRQSPGCGDLLWFGVPIYDNRDRFPKAFKAQDFGGTAKYIFTPGGETYSAQSTHDGKWITIEKDLLPLMREALAAAWAHGFLKDSHDLADYGIGGMNMGWEVPGTFDVAVQVRKLSLRAIAKSEANDQGRRKR